MEQAEEIQVCWSCWELNKKIVRATKEFKKLHFCNKCYKEAVEDSKEDVCGS